MPTLRAILTWVIIPLLLAYLAPGLIRLLPMLRDGQLYEWLRDLPRLETAALGLLAVVVLILHVLRRIELRHDFLAARQFLRLWDNHRSDASKTVRVSYAGSQWTVLLSPNRGRHDLPQVVVTGEGSNRNRRKLERLLLLAWRVHRDSEDRD